MPANRHSIITLPNPHLRQRSKKVGFVSEDIKSLIADMESATIDWEENRDHELGVALAAIQIDTKLRVVIIREDFSNKENKKFRIFINPEITKYEGKLVEDYEGCLSIKDVYGKVPRHEKVRIKALNENGKEVRMKATGFLARVFQHEIDHTNGVVFIDHIKDKPEAFYNLDSKGELTPLDYEKDVRNKKALWN